MPVGALKPLIQALLAQVPDDPTSIVIGVRSETEAQTSPASPNGQRLASSGPTYDPATIYLLEFCTILALRDSETVATIGADVAEALQNVMRNPTSYHSIMVSRTMFYLLHLLHASYVSMAPHLISILLTV
jgi:brefeldin A-resistance guanine nucleotide exchange factor 1